MTSPTPPRAAPVPACDDSVDTPAKAADAAALKADIRAAMRARRLALSPEEREEASRAAARHLMESDIWRQARAVGLYMAVRGEMDTADLAESAWKAGKTLLLPVCGPSCNSPAGTMRFMPCPGPHCLKPGAFSIPEPDLAHPDLAAYCAGDAPLPELIVVPGMAFSPLGQRLGMGGGYYDRFFAAPALAAAVRVGLAYSFQITDSLPQEAWDAPMHALCTEKGLLWIHGR